MEIQINRWKAAEEERQKEAMMEGEGVGKKREGM